MNGAKGSPPHTRGKVCALVAIEYVSGITPAHAGKSSERGEYVWHTADHPRTRGEKDMTIRPGILTPGSPPHTRGKVDQVDLRSYRPGITPAHAGKSYDFDLFLNHGEDHPRTRGEKL